MKRNWHKSLIPMLSLALSSSAIAADGGEGTRGGGSLVFVKGKWELADFFVGKALPGQPMMLSPEVRNYVKALRELVSQYGVKGDELWDQILNPRAEYRVVEGQLPCPADPLPVNDPSLKQEAYGCTQNGVTYLLVDKLNRLEFKNRVLALIHERAHAFDSNANAHDWIAPFINSLKTLISLKEEQVAGSRRTLFPQEVRDLETLVDMHVKLSRTGNYYKEAAITPYGGGIFWSPRMSKIDDSSFVGIGSQVFGWNETSDCESSISDSSVIDSTIACANLKGSQIVNSELSVGSGYSAELQVIDSSLESVKARYYERSKIEFSNLKNTRLEGRSAGMAGFDRGRFEVANSTLTDSEVLGGTLLNSTLNRASTVECWLVRAEMLPGSRCEDALLDVAEKRRSEKEPVFKFEEGARLFQSNIRVPATFAGAKDSPLAVSFGKGSSIEGLGSNERPYYGIILAKGTTLFFPAEKLLNFREIAWKEGHRAIKPNLGEVTIRSAAHLMSLSQPAK